MIHKSKAMADLHYLIGWSGLDRRQISTVLGLDIVSQIELYDGETKDDIAMMYLEILTNYMRLYG